MSDDLNEISVFELHKKDTEYLKKQTIIFEDVLKKCYTRIKMTNDIKKVKECVFEIPQIIYGHPRFDIEACMIFIILKLKEKGYKAKQKSETEIKINWKPKDPNKKKEIKNAIKESEKKPKKNKSLKKDIFFNPLFYELKEKKKKK